MFLYLVNRRIPVDFRQFLIRHVDLFRCLHHWTVRLLVPRRFRKAVALYKAARPRGALDSAESEREQVSGDVLSRTPGAGRTPRRSVRSLHRAGVPEAGHAEDPGPLSGLATSRRQGAVAVVLDLSARRSVLWPFGCRSPAAEPPVPPAHRLDGPGCVGQEGGEAKIASGWPPGFGTLSGRSLTPGGSMNAHSRASVCIAAPCRGRATEAALCAAVTVGVGVAVGEPTMA